MKIKHYTTSGSVSEVSVPAFLEAEVNDVVMAQAIRVYLGNARQGTSKTKTRSEINRSKKKWFKQKGTGNARHGARTPSIFVGGGVSHGPNGMQNWVRSLPQRLKHQALQSALIAQIENVVVHEGLNALSGKTKLAAELINSVAKNDQRVLVLLDETREGVVRSLRNMSNVLVMTARRVTALEVATADLVVTSSEGLNILEQRLMASVATKSEPVKPAKVKAVKVAAEKGAAVKSVEAKKAAKPAVKKPVAKKVTKK